jgi:aspartyl-tRNA(Asn)/glutamyl-tRNA(Gln) amidotransferase subunit A
MTVPAFADIADTGAALAAGAYSAEELATACLRRIAIANPTLLAFIDFDQESVLNQARASDLRRRAGHCLGPLDGVPIGLKDLFEIEGVVATNGSATRLEHRGRVTATAVARLRAAGTVLMGRTHMVEFAYGGWGTNPLLGTPWNPWDPARQRTPGGSSSGSGVAVAAGLVPAALGSDTGGSIRIPAALVGVVGLKPTAGLISLFGVLPLSTTCDSIGPMTRTVADAALITQALAGPDPRDARTGGAPVPDYAGALAGARSLAGVRIAVLPESDFPVAVHPCVTSAYRDAQRVLRGLGARLTECRFPIDLVELNAQSTNLIGAEVWSTHRAYIEDPQLPIGEWVRRRVQRGKSVTAAAYIDALAHHRQSCASWQSAMRDFDVFLTPAAPIPACPIDAVDEESPIMSAFTRSANHLRACAVSLPAGFSREGMPVGVQLIGKSFDEATLFRIGHAFQAETDWHRRAPGLAAVAPAPADS